MIPAEGLVDGRHVDAHRLHQGVLREPVQLGRNGEREEQGLPGLGEQLEELPEIRGEPQCDHPVGLVQHHDLDVGEVEAAPGVQLEKSAGSGDQQVGGLVPQHALLRLHGCSREDHVDLELREPGIVARAGLDVGRQLPGRDQDQPAQPHGPVQQPGQQWNQIGAGLPRAGLGDADQVVALQGDRNGFALNGGGFGETSCADAFQDRGWQPERTKCHRSSG